MHRLQNINRRFLIYGAILLVAVIGVVLSETVFNRTPAECGPVHDLLEFNQEQTTLIEGKGDNASIADYEAWADGLAERAGRVTDPKLASDAVRVSDFANKFVTRLPALRAQTNVQPGSDQPTPPIVYEMAAINTQISEGIKTLRAACPD
jgi:hypothetical protein